MRCLHDPAGMRPRGQLLARKEKAMRKDHVLKCNQWTKTAHAHENERESK